MAFLAASLMLNRGLLGSLQQLLQLQGPGMQHLGLTFLLQLSAFPEAVTDMLALGLVPVIVQQLVGSRPEAAGAALRLLHNLALHEEGRAATVAADGIAQA